MPNELLNLLVQFDPNNESAYRGMTAAKRQAVINSPGFQALLNPAPTAQSEYQAQAASIASMLPQPYSQEDINTQSQLYGNLQTYPQQMAIQRASEEAYRQAQGQQLSVQGFSQALADQLRGVSGQVQQNYQGAAQTLGGLAQGFSGGFSQAIGGSQSAAGNALALTGSPQSIAGDPAAAADVLYGVGGFIPSEAMAREGAAFSSAAAHLPATALGRGQEQFGAIGYEALVRQEEYKRDLIELAAQKGMITAQKADELRLENAERQTQIAQFQWDSLKYENELSRDQRDFDEQVRQFGVQAAAAKTAANRGFWLDKQKLTLDKAINSFGFTGIIPKGYPGAGQPGLGVTSLAGGGTIKTSDIPAPKEPGESGTAIGQAPNGQPIYKGQWWNPKTKRVERVPGEPKAPGSDPAKKPQWQKDFDSSMSQARDEELTEVPAFITNPSNGKQVPNITETEVPMPRQKAFTYLWNKYGAPLARRYPAHADEFRAAIINILNANYGPPKTPPYKAAATNPDSFTGTATRNPGTYTGGAPTTRKPDPANPFARFYP